jgi:hypothetical protein
VSNVHAVVCELDAGRRGEEPRSRGATIKHHFRGPDPITLIVGVAVLLEFVCQSARGHEPKSAV